MSPRQRRMQARTLVMSLWKVPDVQTRELMVDYYQRVLAGEPRGEALRQAQRAMKRKHPEPLFWGAFVCQGDTGPLPPVVRQKLEGNRAAIQGCE